MKDLSQDHHKTMLRHSYEQSYSQQTCDWSYNNSWTNVVHCDGSWIS